MSSFGTVRPIGVPRVWPSKTPLTIRTVSVSRRWLVSRLWPGRRRSRSGWMSASESGSREGQPSTTAPTAAPCDSPQVVTRKSWPKVLPMGSPPQDTVSPPRPRRRTVEWSRGCPGLRPDPYRHAAGPPCPHRDDREAAAGPGGRARSQPDRAGRGGGGGPPARQCATRGGGLQLPAGARSRDGGGDRPPAPPRGAHRAGSDRSGRRALGRALSAGRPPASGMGRHPASPQRLPLSRRRVVRRDAGPRGRGDRPARRPAPGPDRGRRLPRRPDQSRARPRARHSARPVPAARRRHGVGERRGVRRDGTDGPHGERHGGRARRAPRPMSPSQDFPAPDLFTTGTVGPLGQRVFYIQAREGEVLLTLKAEKEQVGALAEYLAELLEKLGRPTGDVAPSPELVEPIVPAWAVRSLAVGYDGEQKRIVIVAEELREPPEGEEEDAEEEEGE